MLESFGEQTGTTPDAGSTTVQAVPVADIAAPADAPAVLTISTGQTALICISNGCGASMVSMAEREAAPSTCPVCKGEAVDFDLMETRA